MVWRMRAKLCCIVFIPAYFYEQFLQVKLRPVGFGFGCQCLGLCVCFLNLGCCILLLLVFVSVSLIVIFGVVGCLERFVSKNNVFGDVDALVHHLHANYAMQSRYFLAPTTCVRQVFVCPSVCLSAQNREATE